MRVTERLFIGGGNGVRIAASALILVAAACDDPPSAPASAAPVAAATPDMGGATAAGAQSAVVLPYSAAISYGGDLLAIENSGNGGVARFTVRGPTALGTAVSARHYGRSNVATFWAENPSNPAVALQISHRGTGTAVQGVTFGTGRAGLFQISNNSNFWPALTGETAGTGPAAGFRIVNSASAATAVEAQTNGLGPAGTFRIGNTNSGGAALSALTNGTGASLLANHTGASGALALFQSGGVTQIRFDKAGRGYFNGGTQSRGADVAEAFEVEGDVASYAPGDVLAISTESDRRVVKSTEPYSTRIIGVYATQPGVLLSERGVDESLDDMVPVGVVGVIPTRVTAENGAIRRGDLLTTATLPGHAMKAEPITINGVRFHPAGVILGKALEEFTGPGTGLIRVLVNVK